VQPVASLVFRRLVSLTLLAEHTEFCRPADTKSQARKQLSDNAYWRRPTACAGNAAALRFPFAGGMRGKEDLNGIAAKLRLLFFTPVFT